MKPILFNTDMTRAILQGRKDVTRRVVKPQPNGTFDRYWCGFYDNNEWIQLKEPYRSGDILWVRETWCEYIADHVIDGVKYAYRADTSAESERFRKELGYKWRPSIHMPREAARIWLRVTDVRVERLQSISFEDANREGVKPRGNSKGLLGQRYLLPFVDLWDSTIKPADRERYGWAANPWVWVIAFERCEKPEGFDG